MNDERLRSLTREVESRFAGSRLEARACEDEEDPSIRWFLWILDVPEERLREVEDFAIGRALDLYGDGPLPFYVSAASPATTAKYFARLVAPAPPEASRVREPGTEPD